MNDKPPGSFTSKDVGSIEDIRARVAQPVTEIVDNPREYYRVQQILRDRSDLLVHLDQLTAILDRNPVMLNGKHMGGSNVCTTCEAHCVTAEDDRKEIARLQSALRIASEELTQYVDFQQKSGYFEYAAESQKRLDAVNAALSGDSHCAHETKEDSDAEVFTRAVVAGVARWEFFSGSDDQGEVCIGGLRYSCRLDCGVPVLGKLLREALEKHTCWKSPLNG